MRIPSFSAVAVSMRLAVFFSIASMSVAATVDFNSFIEGVELGLSTDLGNGFIADISAAGGVDKAVVFDTAPRTISTGNDPDLTSNFMNAKNMSDSRSFVNAFTIQENSSGGPDDEARGGTLTFEFLNAV